MRKHAYTAAEETCLKPMILAESLGPKHPDVAAVLRDLANRYATLKDHLPAGPAPAGVICLTDDHGLANFPPPSTPSPTPFPRPFPS